MCLVRCVCCRCILTFYQVWAVRSSVYGFELPGEMSAIMEVFQALSFDLGSFLFPSWQCIGGLTTRLTFSGLWPLVLMGMVALCAFLLEAARKETGSFQTATRRSLEAVILISFCVLPSVTRSLFLAFQCESFAYDDFATDENGDPAPTSVLYLSASLNVECYDYLQSGGSTDHAPILATAWTFILLWPLALPLLYAVLLYKCRSAVQNHRPSALSRATRFLWSEYKDAYFWYEMVELVVKLCLTNVLLFINFDSGSSRLLRLFAGLLISVFALTIQLALRPFRKTTDDAIASVVRLLLVLFFVLGIMVKLCDSEGPDAIHRLLGAQVENSCEKLVGLPAAYAVAVLILFAAIMAVVVPLGMLIWQLAFSRSIPILRDARTLEPPIMLLREGERYHLFLCAAPKSLPPPQSRGQAPVRRERLGRSHVWSTGQDQCAVIKRQLQLLMPGAHIFLDVNECISNHYHSFPNLP